MVEHWTVDPMVGGSNPLAHPFLNEKLPLKNKRSSF